MRRPILAQAAVLAGCGVLVAMLSVRCADVNRGIGDACIRNADCLSGLCEGQMCVGLPPTFDANPPFDAGTDAPPVADAGSDTATSSQGKDSGHPIPDATPEASRDAGRDAAPPDAAGDGAAGDGAPSIDGATSDAAPDTGGDAHPSDAHPSDAHPGDGHVDGPPKDAVSG